MPLRLPNVRLPPTSPSTELLTFATAGALALTPLYMALPGATERLAAATARWAPRWERNVGYLVAPAEGATRRIAPPVGRTVRSIDGRLPLGAVARGVDRRIRSGIDRAGGWGG
ncbi:hypothetical protein VPNG_08940 [Cytospora leucostoma]|uniref:Uncharacterized protein n=1 Tax=Cytospora leucostoma TaxID=1230097 RepID=A0A423VW90_9PEZI|nr:hypothetical protein VPNG_08940 [Cytospora leucostoma]